MADQAIIAEVLNVGDHETCIFQAVALGTFVNIQFEMTLAGMAGKAVHRPGIERDLVPGQAEIRPGMVEVDQGSPGRVEIPAMVLAVAGRAARRFSEAGVQPVSVQLPGNILVTFQAERVLDRFQRLVAVGALGLKLGMGTEAAQAQAGLGYRAQPPRAKSLPARTPDHPSQPGEQQEGEDQAKD